MTKNISHIILVSIMASFSIKLYESPSHIDFSAMAFGSAISISIFSFASAGIIFGIYWIITKKKLLIFQKIVWLMWALSVSLILYSNLSEDHHIKLISNYYNAKNCDYSVIFPGEPRITDIYTGEMENIERAEYIINSGESGVFFRVECIKLEKDKIKYIFGEREMISQLIEYTKKNGIENAEFKIKESGIGRMASARGFKKIDDVNVTFEIHEYFNGNSLIIATAGGISSGYPQPGIVEFFKSIRLQNRN